MKLRNFILTLVLLVLFGTSACYAASKECPIEVKIGRGTVDITSLADVVTIQGHCCPAKQPSLTN